MRTAACDEVTEKNNYREEILRVVQWEWSKKIKRRALQQSSMSLSFH